MSYRNGTKRRLPVMVIAIGMLVALMPAAGAEEPAFDPNPHPHSVAVDWVEAMLLAIELNPPAPTATTWRMWVVTSSMYDAYAAYDRVAMGTVTGNDLDQPVRAHTSANRDRAVSYAAHRALSYVYPAQADIFDSVMALHGYPLGDSTDPTTPDGVGNLAAQAVIDARVDDGSNALNGFAQITSAMYPEPYKPYNSADPSSTYSIWGTDFDVNYWTPLRVPTGTMHDEHGNPIHDETNPTSYTDQSFLTPHWGAVEPFAMTSGDQFRPPGPPKYGSDEPYTDALGNVSTNDEAFRSQAAEILEMSGALTDEHKVIAEFWADGPHTWTPPGHWVQMAVGISLRDGHTLGEDVRMYMALTGATLDAGISAWEAKRAYDFVRPATAIQYLYAGQQVLAWAGPNQGAQLIDGSEWRPYQNPTFVTPPFAEFTSGHSTFSAASAAVLSSFAGTDALYDGVTRLGRDYDGDGEEDLMGRHVVEPGFLMFEDGPAATVTLRWDTLWDAADEAGISRRYGGIHFQDGDLRARVVGAQVGAQAYDTAELYWDPFGTMKSTVIEEARDREITGSIRTQLLRRLMLIQIDVIKGRDAAACARLGGLERYVDAREGRGISSSAHEILARQLDLVTESSCD
jgi:hypothetical protein